MSTTSQMENISGYLSGLSSPSGTERMHRVFHRTGVELRRTYQIAHVFQNSKLHVLRSEALEALARHICVQMAHTARVQLNGLHAGRRNGLASTSESMSASITPILNSSCRRSMVRVRVVVLPEPGEA